MKMKIDELESILISQGDVDYESLGEPETVEEIEVI